MGGHHPVGGHDGDGREEENGACVEGREVDCEGSGVDGDVEGLVRMVWLEW